MIAFYGLNGRCLTLTNGQAYDLVMKVAAGELDRAQQRANFRRSAVIAAVQATNHAIATYWQVAMAQT